MDIFLLLVLRCRIPPMFPSQLLLLFFIFGFATSYEDCRVLFHTYGALFLAIFCPRTVMFLRHLCIGTGFLRSGVCLYGAQP